jgi:Domain of unknown function (DUF4260)
MASDHGEGWAAAGIARGVPRALLRTEGAALLAICVILYAKFGSAWWLFLALLLAPDIGMAGYVRTTRVGAATYNGFHTYVPPAILVAAAVLTGSTLAYSIGLVWFAHIGMDRALGYGLKYGDSFQHTHLGFIGKDPRG